MEDKRKLLNQALEDHSILQKTDTSQYSEEDKKRHMHEMVRLSRAVFRLNDALEDT